MNDTFVKYELLTNPFRMTPAMNSNELIWAGFPVVKKKFEDRIKRSIKIPNSSLILNWGEYGSGKTLAARYFNKKEVLASLASEVTESMPFSLDINFPKSKSPVWDIYTQIIDKIVISDLRKYLTDSAVNIDDALDIISDNAFIKNVLKLLFDNTVEENLLKQYLYRTISNSDLKDFSKEGIQRTFSTDNDIVEFLSGLFSILTYQKKAYSCIIIWFDEFEDISILNSTNISNVNNFLKLMLDKTPNNLLIFLNLTQSALMGVEDLSEYLQEAVKSRIKDRVELNMPNRAELKSYIKDLLNNKIYRDTPKEDFYPFNEDVIDTVIDDLGDVSLRRFNEAFSLLLETAAFEERDAIIDMEFYLKNKSEIIGWKQ